MPVVTRIVPPVSSCLRPQGGKCANTRDEWWQLEGRWEPVWWEHQKDLSNLTLWSEYLFYVIKSNKGLWVVFFLRCGGNLGLKQSVVGAVTTKHGKSPVSRLVCLTCLSHPLTRMACSAPHTPPSLTVLNRTVSHRAPPIQLQSCK